MAEGQYRGLTGSGKQPNEGATMVTKNASAAAKALKAQNKRCRELMRVIKSGKASEADVKEFSAMPPDIGPARGKMLAEILAKRA
jgi:hypothetical protein